MCITSKKYQGNALMIDCRSLETVCVSTGNGAAKILV